MLPAKALCVAFMRTLPLEAQCDPPWAQQLLLCIKPFIVKELKSALVKCGPVRSLEWCKGKGAFVVVSHLIAAAILCPPIHILQSLLAQYLHSYRVCKLFSNNCYISWNYMLKAYRDLYVSHAAKCYGSAVNLHLNNH